MLPETLLIAAVIAAAAYFIVIPIYKMFSLWFKNKQPKNPVEDARKRLADVQNEVEAAKLNKQAENLIDDLYKEALEEADEQVHHNQQKR